MRRAQAIAWGRLLKLCAAIRSELPTTVAADARELQQQQLSGGPMPERKRIALVYRLGQKRLLERCEARCAALLRELDRSRSAANGAVLVRAPR